MSNEVITHGPRNPFGLRPLDNIIRDYIVYALRRTLNVSEAARLLRVDRKTIYHRCDYFGITPALVIGKEIRRRAEKRYEDQCQKLTLEEQLSTIYGS